MCLKQFVYLNGIKALMSKYFYFSSKRLFLLACYFVVLLGES